MRALVKMDAGKRQPMRLAVQHGVERLLGVHAELAVALAGLPVGVGVHRHSRPHAQPDGRRLAGPGRQCRQPLQFAQVVHDDYAGVCDSRSQVLCALVDPVHQQLCPRYARRRRHCDLAHAGAIYPQAALVCPAGDRAVEEGLAGIGDAGVRRVAGVQRGGIALCRSIEGCRVKHV